MYKFTRTVSILSLLAVCFAASAETYSHIGRTATPKEITAWDIDVRADFKGLPKGSGSVSKGQQVWDDTCASCHGTFGESNQVFTPIVGGVTTADMQTGRVAALASNSEPARTTLMKLSNMSTLWDYINRAMPWNSPKSLTIEEVYAVTAYILNMGEILPDDFTLSDQNIAEVQNMLPNRNGLTSDHGLWLTNGKPDVTNKACMKNCSGDFKITSSLPDYVRNAHGNIAEQNRTFGAVRGANTLIPATTLSK